MAKILEDRSEQLLLARTIVQCVLSKRPMQEFTFDMVLGVNRKPSRPELLEKAGFQRRKMDRDEWPIFWGRLREYSWLGIVQVGTGYGEYAVYYYDPEFDKEKSKKEATKLAGILDSIPHDSKQEAIDYTLMVVEDAGRKGISIDEARKTVARSMGFEDIDPRAFGASVLRVLYKKPDRGPYIAKGKNRTLVFKSGEDSKPEKQKSPPQAKIITGVEISFTGDPIELEGDMQLEGEGPGGKFTLNVKKLTITFLTLLVIALLIASYL